MPDLAQTASKYGVWEIIEPGGGRSRLRGEGVFGRRFLAAATSLVDGKEVRTQAVLEVLDPQWLTDTEQRDSLIGELLILSKARRPNVAAYLDAGRQREVVYYVTEYCAGGNLSELVQRFGALPERVIALVGQQALTGLREIHAQRLVHRDVKPSGILLERELPADANSEQLISMFEENAGLCRIADFGIVNLVLNAAQTPQKFVGSLSFASPEQIREQPIDERCDVYSLGMTLWSLARGEAPFVGASGTELRNPAEIERWQVSPEEHGSCLPDRLSPEFRTILARMIAKRPEERFADADEARTVFSEYLTAPSGRPTNIERKRRLTRLPVRLEERFLFGERLYSRHGYACYAGVDKSTGASVEVTVAASLPDPRGEHEIEALAGRLCRMSELTMEADCPDSAAPIEEVVWAEDLLVCVGASVPQIALPALLKHRMKARSALRIPEAVAILGPIAEGFDHLAQGGETVTLTCEEIWLSGKTAGAAARLDPEALSAPLTEWDGLHVRFSPIFIVALRDENADEFDSAGPEVTLGTLEASPVEAHPVPVFARLIYRILNGSEVAAAVRMAPEAYVPAVTLSAASNNLIRDLVGRRRAWLNARAVLRELCVNEGISWSAKPERSAAVAKVVAPGVVQSPYAPTRVVQRLSAEQWRAGELFVCTASGRKLALPADLAEVENSAAPAANSGGPPPLPSPRLEETGLGAKTDAPSPRPSSGGPAPADVPRPAHRFAGYFITALCLVALGFWLWSAGRSVKTKKGAIRNPEPAVDGFAGSAPGESRTVAGITFHWCPPTGPGGFEMGSPDLEKNRFKDEVQHAVSLSHGFWMAETELTQGQWRAVTGTTLRQQVDGLLADDTPHEFGGKMQTFRDFYHAQKSEGAKLVGVEGPGMPMFWVSWEDARIYCISATKRLREAGEIPSGWELRLPSEAQWEYACRAGSKEATYGGPLELLGRSNAPVLDLIAWYDGNSGVNYRGPGWKRSSSAERQYSFSIAGPRAVGQKRPNFWGLMDTLGNVSEWCGDWYGAYPANAVADPTGAPTGTQRVLRGGSWASVAAACQAARRMRAAPDTVNFGLGFRPILVPTNAAPAETRR